MKNKISIFQLVILGVFAFLALVGFLVFTNYQGDNSSNQIPIGKVIIWGTINKSIVGSLIADLKTRDGRYKDVIYVEKEEETYNQEILEALAIEQSPDLIILSEKNIYQNLNKIYPIPFSTIIERDYINTYIDAFSIFISKKGILGIPFLIDPMVMYYNKSIFKSEGVVLPPKHWGDFFELSKKITKIDDKKNIIRATIAFGESVNITNFKGILSTLILQSENNIVEEKVNEDTGTSFYRTFNWDRDFANPVSGLKFFTEFSNERSSSYSWNRSLPDSLNYFISGRLAVYFGFASEIKSIRLKNPNLNFDVAEIPAVKNREEYKENKTVFANTWVTVIPKANKKNRVSAYNVAIALAGSESQQFLTSKLKLPPVRKDLLFNRNSVDGKLSFQRHVEPFLDIFYREAIYAKSFIDPNYEYTNSIFKFLIESLKSGRDRPYALTKQAFEEIDSLF